MKIFTFIESFGLYQWKWSYIVTNTIIKTLHDSLELLIHIIFVCLFGAGLGQSVFIWKTEILTGMKASLTSKLLYLPEISATQYGRKRPFIHWSTPWCQLNIEIFRKVVRIIEMRINYKGNWDPISKCNVFKIYTLPIDIAEENKMIQGFHKNAC